MRNGSRRAPLMSKRIAYLTCRSYRGVAIAGGTLPALDKPNFDALSAAANELGYAFDLAFWDEEDLPARGYAGALIRSCWDYHARPAEFIARIEAHERAGLPVFNTPETIRWNSRKTYLKELGAAAIETLWLDAVDEASVARAFDSLGADEIVVKPQVGAGSIRTIRLKRNAWSAADLAAGPTDAAMAQAFLKSIESAGEWSLFWFGGRYSHAIHKAPKAGDWLANVPGQTKFTAQAAPRSAQETAESALALSPQDLLYVRVDLVLGDDGAWLVIEIEAIEPHLFLDLAPEGAGRLAGAVSSVFAL